MIRRSARSAAGATFLFAVAMILVLSNCTSSGSSGTASSTDAFGNTKSRGLASLPDPRENDPSAMNAVSSADPKAELAKRLDKYTRVYYRAQAYLADFDKKLADAVAHPQQKTGKSLFTDASPTGAPYARLVASWVLAEKIRSQLSQAYLGAADAEIASMNGISMGDPAEKMAKIKMFADEYSKALRKSGAQRIALQGVYEEIGDASAQIDALLAQSSTNYASLNIKEVSRTASNLVLGEGETAAYYKESKPDLDAEAAKAVNDDEITQEIESLVPAVADGLSSHDLDRQPQSVGSIHPDPGPAGSVSGSAYRLGTWSLSFDDGPHKQYTPAVLQNLKNHGLKGTFFMLSQNAARTSDQVTAEKIAGMVQGDHSYNHPVLSKLPEDQLQFQIVKSYQDLTRLIGVPPKFFRCPYGACGPQGSRVRQLIASENMIHVFWTVDSLDWQDHNPESIHQRVLLEMKQQGRGIILFHDIHPQSVIASNLVMDDFVAGIKAKTLRSITVQQGVDEINAGAK
jgi:peptidoglycan/xylan/chitin deacetylase (PgdA/CDA1 family)